ncbi:unnamed protein product [Didymodactylos carnosus]|uniref:Uncharacterized protein n=1 Tax=Didymodactylos carnosus TaxID=1234261 RepID=A0A814IS32_9BILA|nr:unnamed protein product [Didymodactylos carnosus]CAF1029747.1 unnamed protein product [Didymodactylos carnosus]CAF3727227.1 unnamed protein product [Didymodactylos carnosus]CAF3800699.1 unnamed protein product [Didymodactylos carnosus]
MNKSGHEFDKTILAADIAEAKIAHHETPANDPHKKADRENIGHQPTGTQTTIKETPPLYPGEAAALAKEIQKDEKAKEAAEYKTILAADIAEAKIAHHETPANDPHKKADRENIGHQPTGSQSTIEETPSTI